MKKIAIENAIRDKIQCHLLNPPGGKTNNIYSKLRLEKITSKQIYQIFIYPLKETPTSLEKWFISSSLNENNWKHCFTNIKYLTKNFKIRQHQFRILHNYEITGHNLEK
jgi:hypothetical protein